MGQAPKVMAGLQLGQEERQKREQKWALNPKVGEFYPEEEPTPEPEIVPKPQPAPVKAARQLFD
jgi:hypothetical protein